MSIKTRQRQHKTNHEKDVQLCPGSCLCICLKKWKYDESIIFKMMEGHGLGMGCMEGTCGAITGAVAVIGAIKSCGDIEKPVSKVATYKLTGELVKRFQEKNQATKCKDLKGIETGKVLRSCPGCIEDATAILEEILAE